MSLGVMGVCAWTCPSVNALALIQNDEILHSYLFFVYTMNVVVYVLFLDIRGCVMVVVSLGIQGCRRLDGNPRFLWLGVH